MIYDYRCTCGREQRDVWQRMNDPPPACECGSAMTKLIAVPAQVNGFFFGSTKNPGYHCVVSDRYIDTKQKRIDVMKEFNVSPVEGPRRFPAPDGSR